MIIIIKQDSYGHHVLKQQSNKMLANHYLFQAWLIYAVSLSIYVYTRMRRDAQLFIPSHKVLVEYVILSSSTSDIKKNKIYVRYVSVCLVRSSFYSLQYQNHISFCLLPLEFKGNTQQGHVYYIGTNNSSCYGRTNTITNYYPNKVESIWMREEILD